MNASVKCEYALRAVLDLALAGSSTAGPIRIADIASRQQIPQKFLETILSDLRKRGLLESRRGAEGGYMLARPAETITVGEVVRAVEGGRSAPLLRSPAAMSDPTPRPFPAPRFDPARRRAVTFALVLVTSLSSFESTVVTTAMPTIIGDLHGLPLYSWVFSVYLFGSTITMPIYGRLADVHGRRRMMLLAIALFAGSSLLCAFARTMPHLIIARGLQGLGAGGLIPLALTVSILRSYRRRRPPPESPSKIISPALLGSPPPGPSRKRASAGGGPLPPRLLAARGFRRNNQT